MGMLSGLRSAFVALMAGPPQTFTAPDRPIDRFIVSNGRAGFSPSVDRDAALQVPAVLRGRNLICSISTLPLAQIGPNRAHERSSLLEQIDPQVPNVVTLAQTVEDVLFDGKGWWRVTQRGWNNFPTAAKHINSNRVYLVPPPGAQSLNLLPSGADPDAAVWIDSEVVDGRDMIRFDSPNPPLLTAARRAIRRAIMLEKAAERYARSPKALGYFTPADGADPADDDDIAELLADWNEARNDDAEGYVPASLKYNPLTNPSPADLQLVELQARVSLDIANAIGLDPEDLGVSTTSRTYQNATDRRQDRINDTLAPYMRAITDRLSMNDVTRRGYVVKFDLSDYLKADPITRASVATQLHALGALTVDEIRTDDSRPMLTQAQIDEVAQAADTAAASPAPMPSDQGVPVMNAAPRSVQFSADDHAGQHFTFEPGHFAVDSAKRTITGEIVPYNKVGQNNAGRWLFEPGSITWNSSAVSRVKMNADHYGAVFGAATAVSQTPSSVAGSFKVGRGPVGDAMLMSAEDGIMDGLSGEVVIGAYTIDNSSGVPVNRVSRATLTGVALTASPAFEDARVTKVAASAQSEGNTPMKCSICGQNHAVGAPCAVAPVAPATFSADDLRSAVEAGVALALASGEGPTVVNPRRETASLSVTRSEMPYAFNGRRSAHDFSTDLFASIRGRDSEAQARIDKFMAQAFVDDVSTGDVNELNPTRNRPDLYVDNLDFTTPVWDAINKGSIPDSTPFTVPKFSTATTVVTAHSEGTEPTAGVFTTAGQTITPSAVSGKFEITRETIDQGGNPQVSTIIWREIVRAYNEALEVAGVAMLDALAPTGIVLNGTDADLDQDMTANFAALQYIRGGNRFSKFFVASDLFAALAGAVDDNGRRLYPILAPQNAAGTTAPDYAYVQAGSLQARPAWALEVANGGDGSSYLFNPDDVHGWATAPRRFDFEYEVKSVWLGVMGYLAVANTRLGGVREVTYVA